MPKLNLDILDKKLVRLLKQDGRVTMAHMANRPEVTAPTVRSRIKALIQSGILGLAGLVNLSAISDRMTALIGINIESCGQLISQLEKLTSLKPVHELKQKRECTNNESTGIRWLWDPRESRHGRPGLQLDR